MKMKLVVMAVLLLGICPVIIRSQSLFQQAGVSYRPSFMRLRDTLFLLDSSFLEVRLDQQRIIQHFRGGRINTYPCSTGDPGIKDGIATRPGIFTVQSKARKAMSQEFKVYLNYWMQFDGGIGFHGLDGRSYYRHLGAHPSSHGCVRISNETGARLFPTVPPGTLVYVHSGSPARIIAFSDPRSSDLDFVKQGDDSLLAVRLDAVVAGRWNDPSLQRHLVLPSRKRVWTKAAVGTVNPRRIIQLSLPLVSTPVRISPSASKLASPDPLVIISSNLED